MKLQQERKLQTRTHYIFYYTFMDNIVKITGKNILHMNKFPLSITIALSLRLILWFFFCDYMFISFIRNICGWKVVMWILVIDKCKHNWSEIVFHCFRFKRDNKKNLTEKIPSLWYSFSQVTYECNNWIQFLFWLKVV